MMDLKNVLDAVNEIIVLPLSILSFFLLMYIVVYLWKKDPDVIRSRIFLKYGQFKKAFLLLAVFAFVLIFHVLLIYTRDHFPYEYYPLIADVQRILGLVLVIIMVSFAYYIFRSISNNVKNLKT